MFFTPYIALTICLLSPLSTTTTSSPMLSMLSLSMFLLWLLLFKMLLANTQQQQPLQHNHGCFIPDTRAVSQKLPHYIYTFLFLFLLFCRVGCSFFLSKSLVSIHLLAQSCLPGTSTDLLFDL